MGRRNDSTPNMFPGWPIEDEPEETLPYQPHSPTSRAAAESAKPKASALRTAVLEYLERRGSQGATDHEMQEALSMNPSTQRPRRVELVNCGRVGPAGCTRKTPSGRNAQVWVALRQTDG